MIDYTNMAKHRRSKTCMKIKQELENNQTQNNQIENNNVINNQNNEYADNDFSEEYILYICSFPFISFIKHNITKHTMNCTAFYVKGCDTS